MNWFEHGDVRIHVEEWGKGDPVLLLPGLFGSIDEVRAVGDALAGRYRVIAADLPGSGQSQPQPRAYTPDYYINDAASFAAFLRERVGAPAHLVGYSDGGETELLVAAMAPDLVRSVAAWGTAGSVPQEGLEMLGAMETMVDEPIEPMREFGEYLIAAYGKDNARTMTRNWAAAARGLIGRGGAIALTRAAEIRCPVLLIVGDRDMFVPVDVATEFVRKMPQGEISVLPGAGHAVQFERPEWLATSLLEFLARFDQESHRAGR